MPTPPRKSQQDRYGPPSEWVGDPPLKPIDEDTANRMVILLIWSCILLAIIGLLILLWATWPAKPQPVALLALGIFGLLRRASGFRCDECGCEVMQGCSRCAACCERRADEIDRMRPDSEGRPLAISTAMPMSMIAKGAPD